MRATFLTTAAPPVATLTVAGELDIACWGQLDRCLIELTSLECSTVRLDVGQVTYVDARSLLLIDRARERLEAGGATLEIPAMSLCFGLVSRAGRFTALVAAEGARGR